MKKILLTFFFILLSCSLAACASNKDAKAHNVAQSKQVAAVHYTNTAKRIVLRVNQQQVVVRLYDNPASHDLLSMLPLTLSFKEYAASEKIAYLPRKLDTRNMRNSSNVTGDFNYFAPWSNLAIFYKGKVQASDSLVVLGSIESGTHVFDNLNSDFTVTIDKLD